MTVNLRNRNFLKLLDFTPAEIRYLLDLSIKLKRQNGKGTSSNSLKARILLLFLKRLQHVHDAPSKLQLTTRGRM